ncbi:MAG: molecular chaperone [Myxococcota bacterium]
MPASSAALLASQDRARVYRALAGLFQEPDGNSLARARERDLPELRVALQRLAPGSDLVAEARSLSDLFDEIGPERLRRGHHDAFDESSGIRSAPTEMDQLDGPPQLEMTRTFEMADVAGFYKAFGVEVDPAGVRVDHITSELEFMNLLAVKESIALQEEGDGEHARICRDASRAFLRDHLVRWAPRLGGLLAESDTDPVFCAAGRLLRDFVTFDAALIDAESAPVHIVDPVGREAVPESI